MSSIGRKGLTEIINGQVRFFFASTFLNIHTSSSAEGKKQVGHEGLGDEKELPWSAGE